MEDKNKTNPNNSSNSNNKNKINNNSGRGLSQDSSGSEQYLIDIFGKL